ncbi:hypothetical protein [Bradyrhizobium sp.]|uniref:hypothetical protein n=1 Tax=Bradyrhizobium sp. TaxID=376 RepID=UPI001430DDED|nr:hypothetical protein [Bradyrhizobium sp.]
MTKQNSGETRREDANACMQLKCELEEWRCRLILRHCERSESIPEMHPWKMSGLLRRKSSSQ